MLVVEAGVEFKVQYAGAITRFLGAVLRQFPALFFDTRMVRRVTKSCNFLLSIFSSIFLSHADSHSVFGMKRADVRGRSASRQSRVDCLFLFRAFSFAQFLSMQLFSEFFR